MFTVTNISGNSTYANDIFNIDLLCFPNDAWSFDLIERELKDGKTIYIICKDNLAPVAYLSATKVLDQLSLDRIAVLDKYRKKGIGKMLINCLVDIALQNNVSVINLEVRSNNLEAVSLYTKCNFTFDTIRKNYYQNPLDDAILMSLTL